MPFDGSKRVVVKNGKVETMDKLDRLFRPGMIGKLELRNRIILAPMLIGYGQDYYTTDEYTVFLSAVDKGGVGLVITGATRVVEEIGILSGSLGIFDDKFIPTSGCFFASHAPDNLASILA